jgi:ectoine hydroxylase-related dioxygenase (phytanoyl-CoA dioxygenase family)
MSQSEEPKEKPMQERHPLNRSFAWQPSSPEPRTITPDQALQFDEQGWFLLKKRFSDEELDEVEQAIAPLEAAREAEVREAGGQVRISRAGKITFTANMVRHSEVLERFSRHPVFTGLVQDLIGPDVRLYHDQAVYKKPGNPERFPWHQDNGYRFLEPQQYLTCWVALSDATRENGCPQVVPGLHRLGTLRHWQTEFGWECLNEAEKVEVAEAERGDVVVFSSLTPHLTGPNLTDAVRKAYILQYAPEGARVIADDRDPGTAQNNPEYQYLVTA